MNFNNQYYGNPYMRNFGTQPYMQPQFAQQPQPTQPQQPVQYEIPLMATIYGTLKEAEGHIVYPNTKILFIDKAKGMSYLKTANNDGQSSMRYFKQVEVLADGTPLKAEETAKPTDLSNFVKKEELGQFVSLEEHNKLLAKFEELKKMIGGKPSVPTKQSV